MSKAYKCDRCGKFYEENIISHENERRYLVTKNAKGDGMIREHDFDLCGECQEMLEKFLLKQMFTADEVGEIVYEYGLKDDTIPLSGKILYTPKQVCQILKGEVKTNE